MSVFSSNTLIFAPECWKSILRSPDFKFFPETQVPYKSEFPPLHRFQSFSHLLKILMKTLMDPCPLGKWALKDTCLAKKSTCPRLSDSTFYEHWSVGKHCIWCITCDTCLLLLFYADLFPDGTYFLSKYSWQVHIWKSFMSSACCLKIVIRKTYSPVLLVFSQVQFYPLVPILYWPIFFA